MKPCCRIWAPDGLITPTPTATPAVTATPTLAHRRPRPRRPRRLSGKAPLPRRLAGLRQEHRRFRVDGGPASVRRLRRHDDPRHADVVIVNTCGFIGPAKEESLRVLRELAEAQAPGPAPDGRRLPDAALRRGGACPGARASTASSARAAGWMWSTWSGSCGRASARSAVYHLPEAGPVVMDRPGIPRRPCRAPAPISRSPTAAAGRAPSAPSRSSRARPSAAPPDAILARGAPRWAARACARSS